MKANLPYLTTKLDNSSPLKTIYEDLSPFIDLASKSKTIKIVEKTFNNNKTIAFNKEIKGDNNILSNISSNVSVSKSKNKYDNSISNINYDASITTAAGGTSYDNALIDSYSSFNKKVATFNIKIDNNMDLKQSNESSKRIKLLNGNKAMSAINESYNLNNNFNISMQDYFKSAESKKNNIRNFNEEDSEVHLNDSINNSQKTLFTLADCKFNLIGNKRALPDDYNNKSKENITNRRSSRIKEKSNINTINNINVSNFSENNMPKTTENDNISHNLFDNFEAKVDYDYNLKLRLILENDRKTEKAKDEYKLILRNKPSAIIKHAYAHPEKKSDASVVESSLTSGNINKIELYTEMYSKIPVISNKYRITKRRVNIVRDITCEFCGMVFDKPHKKGSHYSKFHKGMSLNYKRKLGIKINKQVIKKIGNLNFPSQNVIKKRKRTKKFDENNE